MKKLWVSVLILITIIVVAGCGGGSGNSTDPNVGTLQVKNITTKDGAELKPLKDALVEVIGTNCKGTSDTNGNVTIGSIPVGTYLVKCSFTGKAPVYTLMKITTSTSTWEKVALITWDQQNTLAWFTGFINKDKCNLNGSVVAADGKTPLSDVKVAVSPAADKLYYYGTGDNGVILDETASMTDGSGKLFAILSPKTKYTITASDNGKHSFDPIVITIPDDPCMFDLKIRAK